jgi:hypothetical protein
VRCCTAVYFVIKSFLAYNVTKVLVRKSRQNMSTDCWSKSHAGRRPPSYILISLIASMLLIQTRNDDVQLKLWPALREVGVIKSSYILAIKEPARTWVFAFLDQIFCDLGSIGVIASRQGRQCSVWIMDNKMIRRDGARFWTGFAIFRSARLKLLPSRRSTTYSILTVKRVVNQVNCNCKRVVQR